MLVVVEGMDCSGKDTLTAKLIEVLTEMGHEIVSVREPSDHNKLCQDIRHTLEFGGALTDIHRHRLLMKSRECLMREVVGPAVMKKQAMIVSNRSFFSTLAYQATLDPDEVFEENKRLLHYYDVVPDIVVFLDINHATYLSRIRERDEKKSTLEKWIDKKENFDSVRERYLDTMYDKTLFRSLGGSKDINVLLLDGELPIESNVKDILRHLN